MKKKLLNMNRKDLINPIPTSELDKRTPKELQATIHALYGVIHNIYYARMKDLQEAVVLENKLSYIDRNTRMHQVRRQAERILHTTILTDKQKLNAIMEAINETNMRRKKQK